MSPAKAKTQIPIFDLKLSAASIKEVNAVLKSGWLSTGPKVAAFEKEIGKVLKVPNVAAVSSATDGLFLALRALDIKEGDEVITTPFTFVATVEVILHTGATPVLADIDINTLNIDPKAVENRITENTKAVLAVDIAGYPADYENLQLVCQKRQLKLISDSAHAFGATYDKMSMPQLTDASVYSFYSTKNVTSAEGGAVVSRNEKLVDRIRLLARHGLTSNAYDRKISGVWQYDVPLLGYKANMSDVHAAIGLGELSAFAGNQKKKEALVKKYLTNLKGLEGLIILPPIEEHYQHAWHLFIIQLELEKLMLDREQFMEEMSKRGIECGLHYRPIFELSYFSDLFSLSLDEFPNAAKAGSRAVSLPLYPTLKAAEVDYVCKAVNEILHTNSR
ncbi:MAG: DegT/DnrJ/EryC1/StrS family aminotransferase [Candidatus Zixiibacteriota bacterium]